MVNDRYAPTITIAAEEMAKGLDEARQRQRLRERLRELVDRQAEDHGLWFIAQTAPEAYLQQALCKLHAEVEAYLADA